MLSKTIETCILTLGFGTKTSHENYKYKKIFNENFLIYGMLEVYGLYTTVGPLTRAYKERGHATPIVIV